MLQISAVDLRRLVEALDDHSSDHAWWLDPGTGRIELRVDPADGQDDFDTDELIPIEPIPTRLRSRDMKDFLGRVRDPRARALLAGADGDQHRFRETVSQSPVLRDAWLRFLDVRRERRAIQWLADEGVISASVAERELARRPDTERPRARRPADGHEIAERVYEDLRSPYGHRLRDVVLVGSRARGEGHPESDVDLLVVLDEVDDLWSELARMDPVLWHHSFENDVVVTAVPLSEQDMREFKLPAAVRARYAGGGRPWARWSMAYATGNHAAGPDRSREELDAARLLAKHGFRPAAVSRAYLAALFAAQDALFMLGESRANHAQVVALFSKLVVREGGIDASVARGLRSLYERRDAADEARVPVPGPEAERAVEDADQVVTAVEVWLGAGPDARRASSA